MRSAILNISKDNTNKIQMYLKDYKRKHDDVKFVDLDTLNKYSRVKYVK